MNTSIALCVSEAIGIANFDDVVGILALNVVIISNTSDLKDAVIRRPQFRRRFLIHARIV